ncbi:2-dehydropantoate 2-reductase [Pseudomonas silvicola]|nr:2-dehydropantoate 2-reductase [Pseudomonas silvicola]
MRIGVIGAGAMGGLFGTRLATAGHDVAFIEVSRPAIDAIRTHGLQLLIGDEDVRIWPEIGEASDFTDPFELLMIFTKGFHTAQAIEDVRHLLTPATWVLSVQNGLGNAELIAGVVKPERIIVGTTDFPSQLLAPGCVSSHGRGCVRIWSHTGEAVERVMTIAAAFDDAGLTCTAEPQVQVSIWEKLAFNAALNSICSVTGLTVGKLGQSPSGKRTVAAVVGEAVSVAQAMGVNASKARITAAIDNAFAHHTSHKPSMLQDIEAGRRTENDFIAGAVVRMGLANQVPVPVTQTLHALVQMKDQR